jgi:ABC-type glutathione transport system ATPase component
MGRFFRSKPHHYETQEFAVPALFAAQSQMKKLDCGYNSLPLFGEAVRSNFAEEALYEEDFDYGSIEDLEIGEKPEPKEDYIRFQNVRKIYRMGEVEIEALAGVDFTIRKGELAVITGASGAGKSTIRI